MDGSLTRSARPYACEAGTWPAILEAEGETTAGWWACYTMARSERKVDTLLRRRGCESFLPMVETVSQWSDRRKRVSVPLFPGYVFAHAGSFSLGEVMSTPGVAAVVKFDGRPVVIAHEEISNIARFARAMAETGFRPARTRIQEGQRVRIRSGPFEGVYGVVKEVRGRARVLVGLAGIGLGFEVDVSEEALQLLAHA